MSRAVTFDFHNTIARCDGWFELEVRQLAAAYLEWEAALAGTGPVSADLLARARAIYRELRLEIMDHGNELTAEACVIEVLRRLNRPADLALIVRGVAELMRREFATVTPMPGAISTIRGLHAAGVPLGIISSAVYHPFLEWTIARFGLREAFLVITTTASAGLYKSRPALFWHTAAALGAEPATTVHVGDSFRFDVEGGARAGLRPVWLQLTDRAAPASEFAPALTLTTLSGADEPILQLLASL